MLGILFSTSISVFEELLGNLAPRSQTAVGTRSETAGFFSAEVCYHGAVHSVFLDQLGGGVPILDIAVHQAGHACLAATRLLPCAVGPGWPAPGGASASSGSGRSGP